MTDDRQLRAEVVRALEGVTPPAPWLAASVGAAVRERSHKKGGRKMVSAVRLTGRGLTPVLAAALVVLVAAAAIGAVLWRSSLVAPVPAEPQGEPLKAYAQLLQDDWPKVQGAEAPTCNSPADTDCPAVASRIIAACQAWVADLDATRPPAGLDRVHQRLRADLLATISDLQQVIAAFNAGNANDMGMALGAAAYEQDAFLDIKTYVATLAAGSVRALSPSEAAFARRVAQDYDGLAQAKFSSAVVACPVGGPSCTASFAAEAQALRKFQADLQAAPASFAGPVSALLSNLSAEARDLDDLKAAYAAGDVTAVWVDKQNLNNFGSAITFNAGLIMYAGWAG